MGTTVDLIDACRRHVDAEAAPSKKQALDHFRERYTVLLDFLRSEGLLADSTLGKDLSDWTAFEFRKSHLTKEGYELVRRCHGKWRPAYGQGHTQRHLIQWRRELAQRRADTSNP